MADQDSRQSVFNALLASGFPFQTAVAHVVQQVDGCTLVAQEYPWRDDTGDQFLDLVAIKGHFFVSVECKKTQKETFTFLQPGGADGNVNRARCVYLTQVQDHSIRRQLFCSDWSFMPKSTESAFCVLGTSASGKDQRLLERDAQRLVRGTDAYASAQRFELDFQVNQFPRLGMPILPVIVTNAKMFVAEYGPGDVSLETGQLPMPQPATLSPVEWTRFRKAFTPGGNDVGHRTVFVVSATALPRWLDMLDITTAGPSENGKVQIA